jgi:hypothetical protein
MIAIHINRTPARKQIGSDMPFAHDGWRENRQPVCQHSGEIGRLTSADNPDQWVFAQVSKRSVSTGEALRPLPKRSGTAQLYPTPKYQAKKPNSGGSPHLQRDWGWLIAFAIHAGIEITPLQVPYPRVFGLFLELVRFESRHSPLDQ